MMPVKGPSGLIINFPDGTDPQTIDRVMRQAHQQQSADPLQPASDRISGAFDVAKPVRQVDQLVEPRSGWITTRDRLGGVHPGGLLGEAFQTVNKAGEALRGGGDPSESVDAMIGLGALGTPINPAVRAGELAIPGLTRAPLRKAVPKVPTRDELYAAGDAGYTQARRMGVDYNPNFVADLAAQTQGALDRDGFNIRTARNTFNVLRDLQRIPKTGPGERPIVQLDDLETARKALRRIPKGPDYDQDREAARRVIGALDQFTEEPPAAGVLAGPAAAAGAVQKEARGNWAAMERSKEVAGKQKYAQWRAWASNSGANIDNALRQRVTDLLIDIDKGRAKGFSKAEQEELIGFVKGSKTRNFSRKVANLLGGGGGLGALLTGGVAGAYAGMPAALALPAFGLGTKATENALARGAMRKLDETVRKRSPLYQQRSAAAPAAPMSPATRAAALRALTLTVGGDQNGFLTPEEQAAQRRRLAGGGPRL